MAGSSRRFATWRAAEATEPTDDGHGDYEVRALPAGNYYVKAAPRQYMRFMGPTGTLRKPGAEDVELTVE